MKPGYLRPVLDLESGDTNTTKAQLSDWVVRFMNTIVAAKGSGATPLIYVNTNFATNELDATVSGYDLWLARPSPAAIRRTAIRSRPRGSRIRTACGATGTPAVEVLAVRHADSRPESDPRPGIGPEVDLEVVHDDVTPLASFKVPA
jgi:hypothetical protein